LTITLQVTPRLARALRAGGKSAAALVSYVAAHQGRIIPAFEGNDSTLVNFFLVEGIDGSKIEELVYALQRIEGIEAAYVKPAEELP
jgi:hypothetical protein